VGEIMSREELQRRLNVGATGDVWVHNAALRAEVQRLTAANERLTRERGTARRAFDAVHDAAGFGFPSWQPGQSAMANTAEVVKKIQELRQRPGDAVLEAAQKVADLHRYAQFIPEENQYIQDSVDIASQMKSELDALAALLPPRSAPLKKENQNAD